MDNNKDKIVNRLLSEIKDASYTVAAITPPNNGPVYYNTNITIRLLTEIRNAIRSIAGGSGSAFDYNNLNNKPQIDGVELNGNVSSKDLGLQTKTEVINHGTSDTTIAINPNVLHTWNEVNELNITLNNSTELDMFMFEFKSGATATKLTLPADIKWLEDDELVPEINRAYQVSIYNGIASYGGYSL